jgi:hypothetical protein
MDGDRPGLYRISAFVSDLEKRLPADAMIFQMPMRPFPADEDFVRLRAYDQFRPYLTSHGLRWSYPGLTRTQYEWEQAMDRLPLTELPGALARQGFSVILISRDGYWDRGEETQAALRRAPLGPTVMAESEDLIALALPNVAAQADGSGSN